MKIIREDPQGFFEQGGWKDMLQAPSDEEQDDADPDDEDFGEDDFAPVDEEEDDVGFL